VNYNVDSKRLAVETHDDNALTFKGHYENIRHGDYETAFAFSRSKMQEGFDKVLGQFPGHASILDIGCGTGNQIKVIKTSFPDIKGLEPAEGMRIIAQQENPDIEIIDGDITHLPYQNNSVDLIYSIEVLRYLEQEDIEKAYREVFRVLKPGGKFFFTMVNKYSLDMYYPVFQFRNILQSVHLFKQPFHCEFVTPNQVSNDLITVGFKSIDTFSRGLGIVHICYKMNRKCGKLMANVSSFVRPVEKASALKLFNSHLMIIADKNV